MNKHCMCALLACLVAIRVDLSFAAAEKVDGITWSYIDFRGSVSIINSINTSNPAIKADTAGIVRVPETLGGMPVVEISSYAFNGCKYVTKIIVPNSVTNILPYAFLNCTGLKELEVGSGLKCIDWSACSGCSALENVDLGGAVEYIGGACFSDSYDLKMVKGTRRVKEIDNRAFRGCRKLEDFEWPDSVERVGNNAFEFCPIPFVGFDDNAKEIGESAFYCCNKLRNVCLPHSNNFVGAEAFSFCDSITNVVINGGSLGEGVFRGCGNLESLFVASSVTNISDMCFYYCSSLRNVTLPMAIRSIGYRSFYGCDSLSGTFKFSDMTQIGVNAFPETCSIVRVPVLLVSVVGLSVESRYDGRPHEFQYDFVCEDNRFDRNSVMCPSKKYTAKKDCGMYVDRYNASDFSYQGDSICADFIFEGECVCKISKRDVCLVADSFEKKYDGEKYFAKDISVSGDGFVDGECTIVGSAKEVLNVGSVSNCINIIWGDSKNASNYEITITNGLLTVLPRFVRLTTTDNEKVYDGEALRSNGVCISGDGFVDGDCVVASTNGILNVGGIRDEVTIDWLRQDRKMNYEIERNVGMLRVYPRWVTLKSADATKVYDGVPLGRQIVQVVSGCFVCDECVATSLVVRTTVGTSKNTITLNWSTGALPTNYELIKQEGTLTVLPAQVSSDGEEPWGGDGPRPYVGGEGVHSLYDTVSVYDGLGHTIDVETLVKIKLVGGDAPQISYALTSNGVYRAEPIFFTNVCFTSIWYKVVSPNHNPYIHEAGISINPRNVRLKSGSATKNYDGKPLTCKAVTVLEKESPEDEDEGFVPGDGAKFNCTGAQTSVGLSPNVFDYVLNSGTLESNYSIGCEYGTLTVTATGVVSIASGITEILAGALRDCSEVTEVRIPDTVRYIGDGAFEGCVGLKKIVFPSRMELRWSELRRIGLRDEFVRAAFVQGDWLVAGCVLLAYVGDPNVSELTVPDGIEIIEEEVFAGLYNLQKIHFCGTEKEIGPFAFRDCTYLDDVVLPDTVEVLGEGAFSGCSYIFDFDMGNGVREIGESAFEGCQTIENMVCSTNLLDVGRRAFADCYYLRDVALPLGVTNVATSAFAGCAALTGVTVPTHVVPLSRWFPEQYKSICSVTIPDDETKMVPSMFEGCQSLGIDPVDGAESIILPEGLTVIPDRAFADCSSIVQLTLPTGVVSIGEAAFERCQFVAFEMPDAVTTVGKGAFRGCSALKDVTLAKSLAAIPDELFAGCASLDSFTVPGLVTQLGGNFVPYQTSAIYFMSNAPAYAENAYDSANVHALVNYVKRGTMGWNGQPTGRVLPTPAVWPANTVVPIKYWEANQFEAVFDANGGYFANPMATTFACKETTFESYAIPPYDPIRPGYVFTGWWTDPTGGSRIRSTTRVTLTKPNDEVQTIYAHWKKGETKWVTIRFNAMGGTVSPAFTNCIVGEIYGNALKSVVPTKEYYDFYGWYTMAYWPDGELQTAETIVPDADRELFARWEPKTYVVRYHANGGTGTMADGTFAYGDKFNLSVNQFKRSGHAFAGWASTEDGVKKYNDGAELSDFGAIEDGVVDLYAVWVAVDCFYSIRFDSNGGVGTMTNQTVRIGDTVLLDPNCFTRTGYAFAGWALRADDYEKVYDDQEPVCNLSETDGDTVALFAVWVKAEGEVASNVLLVSDSARPWQNVPGTVVVGSGANVSVYQSSWQSGAIGDGEVTVLAATVNGEGKIGFWWKVSCEKYKSLKLDNLEFSIDGTAKEPWINGETDWAYLEFEVEGSGGHVLRWAYSKDEEDKDGQDCGWVTGIRWTRKLSSLADYLNCDNLEFVTFGDANWQPDLVTAHDGVASLRSGVIGDSKVSRLETVVSGGGTISFWWNASSESYKSALIDKLTFLIDGVEIEEIGSTSATWAHVTKEVVGAGSHTLTWVYSKDEADAQGEDCGWLDEVSWTPLHQGVVVPAEITGGKEIVVDESWPTSLDAQFGAGTSAAFVEKFGSDLSAALLKSTGKKSAAGEDMYVWQDYVAGTDPTDPTSQFTAKIEMVDGEPVVIWSPKLSETEAAKRVYTTYGKKTLEVAEPWTPVETPAQGGWRFFMVGVEMR